MISPSTFLYGLICLASFYIFQSLKLDVVHGFCLRDVVDPTKLMGDGVDCHDAESVLFALLVPTLKYCPCFPGVDALAVIQAIIELSLIGVSI